MQLALFDARLHEVRSFTCGEPALETWFRRFARRSQRDGLTRVHVLIDAHPPPRSPVLGFFALSMASVHVEDLPEAERARLPRYPVPAVLLTRLAVHSDHQGSGLGRALLFKAAQKALVAHQHVAARLFVVDALDERAASFYRSFGFRSFPDAPLRLAIGLERLVGQLPP